MLPFIKIAVQHSDMHEKITESLVSLKKCPKMNIHRISDYISAHLIVFSRSVFIHQQNGTVHTVLVFHRVSVNVDVR